MAFTSRHATANPVTQRLNRAGAPSSGPSCTGPLVAGQVCKNVTERDVVVAKPTIANAVVSKIMTYNGGHVTGDPEIQLLKRLGGLVYSSLVLDDNNAAMLRANSQMEKLD